MHGLDLSLKDVDAFQKEGALLVKEDWKTLVGPDYQLIGFDLGEVRLHGKIEGNVRRDSVLAGNPGIELNRLVNEAAGIQETGIDLRRRQRTLSFAGL